MIPITDGVGLNHVAQFLRKTTRKRVNRKMIKDNKCRDSVALCAKVFALVMRDVIDDVIDGKTVFFNKKMGFSMFAARETEHTEKKLLMKEDWDIFEHGFQRYGLFYGYFNDRNMYLYKMSFSVEKTNEFIQAQRDGKKYLQQRRIINYGKTRKRVHK